MITLYSQTTVTLLQQEIKHLHFHVIPRHMNEKFEFKLNTDFTAAKKSNLFSIWKKIVGR